MTLRSPSPAQIRGMTYAFPKARIALFMEMRLGKSMVAIRWAKHHECPRVLVVVPNESMYTWRTELILEGVDASDIYLLEGSGLDKLAVAEEIDTGWAIVNYEAIRTMKKKVLGKTKVYDAGVGILKLPWSAILLDESTAIRTPKSSTAKTLLRHAGHIPYRALMSGLPNPHSELDYFNQMAFLHGDFLGFHNYWHFREKLYTPDVRGWTWYPKKDTSERVRKEVHAKAFILSRKDAGINKTITRDRRYVTMTPKQRRMYRSIEKDFSYNETETVWAPVQHTWLARVAGGFSPDKDNPELLNPGKINIILNLLDSDLKKEQLVVWFRFNAELDAMAERLKQEEITYRWMKGGMDKAVREQYRQDFQSGKAQVILMQMANGRFSIDLSASSTAIYYSNVYDWEMRAQTQDRIVNIRKTDPLLLMDLITRDTVDEDAVDVLNDRNMEASLFNSKFRERILASLRLRYPDKPQPIKKLVRRVMPGDT
jgi:SNF2 family DNA or RNA helicase